MSQVEILFFVGILLSLALFYITYKIYKKSHALRETYLKSSDSLAQKTEITTSSKNIDDKKIIINDISNHFELTILKNLLEVENKYLKLKFERILNERIASHFSQIHDEKFRSLIVYCLMHTSLQHKIVRKLNYKKKDNNVLVKNSAELYYDLFNIIIFIYSRNNTSGIKVIPKKQIFEPSKFRFTVKESEQGIETISIE